MNENDEVFLTTAEAAKFLKRSKANIYILVNARKLKFFKPNGKLILFKKSDLIAWITGSEPPAVQGQADHPTAASPLKDSKAAVEIEEIKIAMQRNENHRDRAAASLGITRMALFTKIKKHGLEFPRYKAGRH